MACAVLILPASALSDEILDKINASSSLNECFKKCMYRKSGATGDQFMTCALGKMNSGLNGEALQKAAGTCAIEAFNGEALACITECNIK